MTRNGATKKEDLKNQIVMKEKPSKHSYQRHFMSQALGGQ